jgi:hypothetical protein
LGVYAEAKEVTSHELQEANKAALVEKAITAPIKKNGPDDITEKSGSVNSHSANNLAGRSAAPCASKRGYAEAACTIRGRYAELAFGDCPTDFGFRHDSYAASEG